MKFSEEAEAIYELIADPDTKHKPYLLNQTCQVQFLDETIICIDHMLDERDKKQHEKHDLAPAL